MNAIHIIVALCMMMMGSSSSLQPAALYWNQKLPNTPMPLSIRQILVSDMRNFKFWDMGLGEGNAHIDGPANPVGGANPKYKLAAEDVDISHVKDITTYFLIQDFHPSMKLMLPNSAPTNFARILPRKVSNSIPFSIHNISQILTRFSTRYHTAKGKAIRQVLESCEDQLSIETKECITSLEGMVDFTLSRIGTNKVGIFYNEVEVKSNVEEFNVVSTKMIGKNAVVCHKEIYPYAVYYCHTLEGTTVYTATVKSLNGSKGKVVAICHSDTSTWNARHMAFLILKIKPGQGTVCHLLNYNNLALVSL